MALLFFLQIWILCQNSLTRELKIKSCRVCTLKVIHIFCNVDFTTCFTLCRWLLFCILPLLTVWHTVLVSVFPPPLPTPTPSTFFFSFQIWILCRNSLTRELKIRVVGFALKKLFTHFEMLIVSMPYIV